MGNNSDVDVDSFGPIGRCADEMGNGDARPPTHQPALEKVKYLTRQDIRISIGGHRSIRNPLPP
jgi:hypothetical protein